RTQALTIGDDHRPDREATHQNTGESPREGGPGSRHSETPDDGATVDDSGERVEDAGSVQAESDDNALAEELSQAREEAKANYDRFLRASAELENIKKRTRREMEDFRKFANQSLFKELLVVVDNLERALDSCQNDSGSFEQLVEGVSLTLADVIKIFDKYGIKSIEAIDKPFDPTVHEAVMQESVADVPDNTVIKELQKGYWLHDRLLRPSMVVVSKT
ncbi:MAG: nucleotide exchange factor GrpE, partial [Desulfobacterales bacterium]